jgi:hypothetical protein
MTIKQLLVALACSAPCFVQAQPLPAPAISLQIYADESSTPNTATTSEEVLKTAPVSAGQLRNVGDVLEITAWGTMAGTTDNKAVRVRLGGLGGTILAAPFTTGATGTRWRIIGTIIKSGSNTQLVSGQGIISSIAYATASGAGNVTDTSATTLVVTSQNSTTAAAASITCDGVILSYVKAAGS